MFKKWIHIILSLWLINSVTYFHTTSASDFPGFEHNNNSTSETSVKVNSWADCIIQSIQDDDDDAPASKAHKIKFQRRYVRNRSVNDNIFVSTPNLHLYYQHLKYAALAKINHYSIGVALLPAYYNFLFRLCPF